MGAARMEETVVDGARHSMEATTKGIQIEKERREEWHSQNAIRFGTRTFSLTASDSGSRSKLPTGARLSRKRKISLRTRRQASSLRPNRSLRGCPSVRLRNGSCKIVLRNLLP